MRLVPVRQGGDDVPQGGEGLVDVLGFLQSHPLHPGLADLLATGQVHKIQLSTELLLVLQILLFDVDEENTVGSRAVFVQI